MFPRGVVVRVELNGHGKVGDRLVIQPLLLAPHCQRFVRSGGFTGFGYRTLRRLERRSPGVVFLQLLHQSRIRLPLLTDRFRPEPLAAIVDKSQQTPRRHVPGIDRNGLSQMAYSLGI